MSRNTDLVRRFRSLFRHPGQTDFDVEQQQPCDQRTMARTGASAEEKEKATPEVIELTATVEEDDEVVATCTAHLIERRQTGFHSAMANSSDELGELAHDLYSDEGRLLHHYRTLATHKDEDVQGVWGSSLDRKDILLFSHIKVDKANRRKGLAQSLVARIMKKAARISSDYATFVAPGAVESEFRGLEGDERTRAIAEQVDVAVQFWHAQGFRRVGNTNWLAMK